MMLGETISSLKQDKELLQQELTKKAELICEFLQDQLRPGTHLNIHKSVQKCKIYIYIDFKKNQKKHCSSVMIVLQIKIMINQEM